MDGFTTIWKCNSLQAAVDDIRRHFSSEQEIPCHINTRKGPVPASAPRYLYRGECGLFPETESSQIRFSRTAALQGRDLEAFQGILKALKWALTQPDYANSEEESEGLLEHYGIPTSVINFIASLEVAAAFAVAGKSDRGRICILTKPYQGGAHTWDYRKHPWAARASRQEAFGVRPINLRDLNLARPTAIWARFGSNSIYFQSSGRHASPYTNRSYTRGVTLTLRYCADRSITMSSGLARFHIARLSCWLTAFLWCHWFTLSAVSTTNARKLSPAMSIHLFFRFPRTKNGKGRSATGQKIIKSQATSSKRYIHSNLPGRWESYLHFLEPIAVHLRRPKI